MVIDVVREKLSQTYRWVSPRVGSYALFITINILSHRHKCWQILNTHKEVLPEPLIQFCVSVLYVCCASALHTNYLHDTVFCHETQLHALHSQWCCRRSFKFHILVHSSFVGRLKLQKLCTWTTNIQNNNLLRLDIFYLIPQLTATFKPTWKAIFKGLRIVVGLHDQKGFKRRVVQTSFIKWSRPCLSADECEFQMSGRTIKLL